MPSIIRDFSGKLNLDQSPYRTPKGDYIDAFNITRDAQSAGSDLVVSNIVGNQIVNYTGYQPNTTNIVIGAYGDDLKNRVIYFVWNNQGYHSILNFDVATRTITKILESKTDSGDIDILNFQLLYKVNDVNIIHKDDGDLLFFNDAYNPPRAFNLTKMQNGDYFPVGADVISLAKIPPLVALVPKYQDAPVGTTINNLKKKLFRFIYRWVYDDNYKSTWSPISAAVLPKNAFDIVTDSNPAKNAEIKLTVTAGGANYKAIEIAGQMSLGAQWSGFFLIDSLGRTDYSIAPGNTYDYIFKNDGQYTFLDPTETDLLFSYVPQKANAQQLVNGNVLLYGGITEGYPILKRNEVNVQITSVNTDQTGSNPPLGTMTYTLSSNPAHAPFFQRILDVFIGNTVPEGNQYVLSFHEPVFNGADFDYSGSTTAGSGDTAFNIAFNLATDINTKGAGFPITASVIAPNQLHIVNTQGTYQFDSVVTNVIADTVDAGGTATWKNNSGYRLAIAYFDEDGRTPGAISYVSNSDTDITDFSVNTPDFNYTASNGLPQLPVINASLNHAPPSWAVTYQWLRTTNQSVDFFLQYMACQVNNENGFLYFCIQNLTTFKNDNTGFVPSYTFQSGDRLRVYALYNPATTSHYTLPGQVYDFEILGTVQRKVGSISPEVDGTFIKVKERAGFPFISSPSTAGIDVFVEIYRPAIRTSDNETQFFSFGQSYPIYTDSGTGQRYHRGMIQDQTATQPATFTFTDGDVYYKNREFYTNTLVPGNAYVAPVIDVNYNDYWSSAVNSNGNPFVIDSNAATIYYPTFVRFSQAYQTDTSINQLNLFYFNDNDTYFRDYGAIKKITIRDKFARAYQQLRVGMVPIYQQIVKDQSGTNQVFISDKLLNPINYYEGQFGCGDHPESIAYNNYADYFASNMRTIIGRLSQDGLQPISIQNDINNFCVTELGIRDFNYKAYGVFDSYNNLYILALEETPSSPAKTLVWNEQRNGFETFLSYAPEMMCCLNQLLITFKNGQLYTHDNLAQYNTFYGTTYDSSITPVFNDDILIKKTWMNITEQSSVVWDVPEITTNAKTFDTGQYQSSNLIAQDFEDLETEFSANFRCDENSVGGINDGAPLKGTYLTAKLRAKLPTNLVIINAAVIEYKLSPKTIQSR